MRSLIYDVAVSLDGFIAAPSGDFSAFPQEGPAAEAYVARLSTYGAVLMGRATYDVGVAHGLPIGANPYPHMDCHVVTSRPLPGDAVTCHLDPLAAARALKAHQGAPVYLCGGGRLAGALLAARLIDALRLKCVPILLGEGIPLFAGTAAPTLVQTAVTPYEGDTVLREFEIR